MAKDYLLKLSDLTVGYDKCQPLFVNLNLTGKKGQFIAVTGPSGSGKSSLLRVIAKLQRATTGSINYNLIARDGTLPISMMFQEARLLPWLNIYQNVSFAIKRLNLKKGEIDFRVSEVLKRIGLYHLKDRYAHEISGGQQQRISLARSLVTFPQILLLDEPCSSLDQESRNNIMEIVRSASTELGMLVVYVTHFLNDVREYADFEVSLDPKAPDRLLKYKMNQ